MQRTQCRAHCSLYNHAGWLGMSYEAFHHSSSPFHYSIPLFHSTIPFHHSIPLNVDIRKTEWLTSGSLGDVSWVQKLPHSCTVTQGMCHSSTRPPNVQVCHCTWSVWPGLPHVSTASDKCWGEKAWVRGYTQAQIEPIPTGFTVMT